MVVNGIIVKIWMIKVILLRSQREISNMLLETGGKAMLSKWQRA